MQFFNTKILNETDSHSLLKQANSFGILNTYLADMQRKIDMTIREKYLNLHKENFKIWQGENGKWYTYLPDDTKAKNRRLVKKSTLTKVEEEIVAYYKELDSDAQAKKINLGTFYQTWLDYKKLQTRSSMYIRRIGSDWDNYYKEDPIINIPLVNLDFDTLQEWALKKIRKHDLTKKQYYNMAIIMRQGLAYAVQKKIISENPFEKVIIDKKLFRVQKKPDDKTQVYLIDEQPVIEADAYNDFAETEYNACLTIPFAFQTGLRLGEIVAIKETDIEGHYIHIQRMEIREVEQLPDGSWSKQRFVVVEYTKSDAGDRYVYLSSKALKIIEMVIENNKKHGFHDNGFLFLNEDGRIHAKGVDSRIRKYCRHAGIDEKATHKARKTYISTLIDSGLNINEIRKLVGHQDERTTYNNYCFNRLSKNQTESKLEQALCG